MTDVVEVLEPMGGEQAQAYQRLRTHLSELRLVAAAVPPGLPAGRPVLRSVPSL